MPSKKRSLSPKQSASPPRQRLKTTSLPNEDEANKENVPQPSEYPPLEPLEVPPWSATAQNYNTPAARSMSLASFDQIAPTSTKNIGLKASRDRPRECFQDVLMRMRKSMGEGTRNVFVVSRQMESRYSDGCNDVLAVSETLEGALKVVADDVDKYGWQDEGGEEESEGEDGGEDESKEVSNEEERARALIKSARLSSDKEMYWEFEDESADCNESTYTVKGVRLVK